MTVVLKSPDWASVRVVLGVCLWSDCTITESRWINLAVLKLNSGRVDRWEPSAGFVKEEGRSVRSWGLLPAFLAASRSGGAVGPRDGGIVNGKHF